MNAAGQSEKIMADTVKFWDRMAKRYAKSPIADEAAYQKKLEVTREYLKPSMNVLEFGCGTGSTAITLAPHVKHILATDFSPNMIEIAQAKASVANVGNVTFEVSSIEDLAEASRSFDMVLGHSILHLVDDKEAVLSRVYDLLKPGGFFVSSTVCLGNSYLKYLSPVMSLGNLIGLLPRVKAFTMEDLVASLKAAGFEIDHQWQPGKGVVAFIVAKKTG
jgi:ubiquinone/menaquinone biosynthesis C-methylase UbiE